MQATTVLVGFVAVLVVAWPIAWLLAGLHSAFTGQWLRIAKLCLLIPLWAVAPMLALVELGPFIAAPDAPEPVEGAIRLVRLFIATAASASAWWLLVAWCRQQPAREAVSGEDAAGPVKL
jgi:hypothetical protein